MLIDENTAQHAREAADLAVALHKRVLGKPPPLESSPFAEDYGPHFTQLELVLHELAHHVALGGTLRGRCRERIAARIERLPWTSRQANEVDALAIEILVAKELHVPFDQHLLVHNACSTTLGLDYELAMKLVDAARDDEITRSHALKLYWAVLREAKIAGGFDAES